MQNDSIEVNNRADSVVHHPQDNLKAAINNEAETTLKDLAVPTAVTADGAPADKQVLIRATEHDKDRWKQAAEAKGVTVSEFIRKVLNDAAANILDCSHPLNQRRYYPWAEFCLECGNRLRG